MTGSPAPRHEDDVASSPAVLLIGRSVRMPHPLVQKLGSEGIWSSQRSIWPGCPEADARAFEFSLVDIDVSARLADFIKTCAATNNLRASRCS